MGVLHIQSRRQLPLRKQGEGWLCLHALPSFRLALTIEDPQSQEILPPVIQEVDKSGRFTFSIRIFAEKAVSMLLQLANRTYLERVKSLPCRLHAHNKQLRRSPTANMRDTCESIKPAYWGGQKYVINNPILKFEMDAKRRAKP